ncbi:MAG: hypothetical protein JWO67_4039 [Streptosporangiaceae bacterium]|nr:hypothetical protein [Streptosporangiaceae bacterium]
MWEHDTHVRTAVHDAEKLQWVEWPPSATSRVVERTCWCRARLYELRSAGGHRHIVRTDRIPPAAGPPIVRYTIPLPAAQTDDLWKKLIDGQAK